MKYCFYLVIIISLVQAEEIIDLNQALNLAYKKNQQLLILEEMIQEAKAGKLISLSSFLPHLEGSIQGYYNQTKQQLTGSNNTILSNLSITQNLFQIPAYHEMQITNLELKKAELLYESLKNAITFQVKSSYYKVILDLEKVATQEEHVALLTALLKRMRDKLKIGEAIALNVNQSQVALAAQKTRYYQVLKELKDDRHSLLVTMGYNPDEISFSIQDTQFSFAKYPELRQLMEKGKHLCDLSALFTERDLKQLELKIARFNPVLRAQEMALKVMTEGVKKSQGEYYPKVQLVANYGGTPNPFDFYPSSQFSNQVFQFGVGLELRWNLFDGMKREGLIKKSQHQKLAAFHELENLTQQVALAFTESITGIETGVAQVFSSEENVALADLTQQLAFEQFEIGYYTIYDYQIALDQLIQMKNFLSESKYQLFKSYFELEKVMGCPFETGGQYE